MALISVREFARRNRSRPETIQHAVNTGRLPHVNGKIDVAKAQPVWDALRAECIEIEVPLDDAERAELEAKARNAGLSVEQYIRVMVGLPIA